MLLPEFSTCWFTTLMIYFNIIAFLVALHLSGGVENLARNVQFMLNNHLPNQVYEVSELVKVQAFQIFEANIRPIFNQLVESIKR
mmetsp:Transcript_31683/g.28073  ORF Transcript_31683/g.28073 Transcript_31683/m.28073 type:complete len:85 (-) Transcript_31683:30-284(-)